MTEERDTGDGNEKEGEWLVEKKIDVGKKKRKKVEEEQQRTDRH